MIIININYNIYEYEYEYIYIYKYFEYKIIESNYINKIRYLLLDGEYRWNIIGSLEVGWQVRRLD